MDLAVYFADAYRPRLVAKGVKQATINDYQAIIREAPRRPTARSVTAWLANMRCAPATKNRKRRYLLAVLRQAREDGLVAGWIDRIPKALETSQLPRAWRLEEFELLLVACGRLDEHYASIAAPTWWRAFLLAMWYTGSRVQSLLSVQAADLDLPAGTLIVASSKDRRQILYSLPVDACDALRRLPLEVSPLVWPWPFRDSKKTLLRRMRHLIALAELPQLAKPFHAVRKSVASYVTARSGLATACDALDHSRSSITARYYVDPRIAIPTRRIGDWMPRPRVTA